MSVDEGVVKYVSDFKLGPSPDRPTAQLLDRWRRPLHDAGLIGHDADNDVGYGNLSVRGSTPRNFIISGTQTGHLDVTTPRDYCLVSHYDIDANRVVCIGLVQASSEALTHAALYELDPAIGAVVHAHSPTLWRALLHVAPTTDDCCAYGTPAMAREFARLYRESDMASIGVAVMAGHKHGIVSIGESLAHSARRLLWMSGLSEVSRVSRRRLDSNETGMSDRS